MCENGTELDFYDSLIFGKEEGATHVMLLHELLRRLPHSQSLLEKQI